MCWSCPGKAKQLFAKKDIPIIKILYNTDQGLVSPYRFYKYELNRLYDSSFNIRKGSDITRIYEGLHSYSNKVRIERYIGAVLSVSFKTDTSWDSGWIGLDEFRNPSAVVVLGFIPAGTYYYLNERGEYVSSKLILTSIKTSTV